MYVRNPMNEKLDFSGSNERLKQHYQKYKKKTRSISHTETLNVLLDVLVQKCLKK